VAIAVRRRRKNEFHRAADGSMTLMEHVRELRDRLFKATLGVLAGFVAGYWFAKPVIQFLKKPVCDVVQPRYGQCEFVQLGVPDFFLLTLKVGLWLGLLVASPIWLYQLWAFVAPGLHRHERRYAYVFIAIATPLFAVGAVLSFLALKHGLEWLLPPQEVVATQLEISRYVDFVTTMMIIFGVAFEFPLLALMLNFTGMVSARRLLSWWRAVVFVFFAFAAVVTPTPDPFTMSGLALAMSALYFAAVGVAFLVDRRRDRNRPSAAVGDDEASPLEDPPEPVTAGAPVGGYEPLPAPEPVTGLGPVEAPRPLDRRYDDVT
jgi:sec-independent protein translocase protein TatC